MPHPLSRVIHTDSDGDTGAVIDVEAEVLGSERVMKKSGNTLKGVRLAALAAVLTPVALAIGSVVSGKFTDVARDQAAVAPGIPLAPLQIVQYYLKSFRDNHPDKYAAIKVFADNSPKPDIQLRLSSMDTMVQLGEATSEDIIPYFKGNTGAYAVQELQKKPDDNSIPENAGWFPKGKGGWLVTPL